MNNQLEIIKKASDLIEKKKYKDAKYILLDFKEKNLNIKIDIRFYYTLYLVSDGLRETQNAKKYLEKCIKINDNNYIVLNNLANIYLKEGNIDKAEKFYLKSYNLKEDYLLVIVNLAIFYQNLGKLEEAKKFYLKAIELSPKRISLYFNLSRIDKNFINEKKIKYLKKLIQSEKKELSEISYGYFLLANYERTRKNFDQELAYLEKANKYSFESAIVTNKKTLNYWKNVIVRKYKNFHFINEGKENHLKNFKPIFIIGLPRSGSTITEVLLRSNNNNIVSLGEASIFNGIIAKGFSNDDKKEIDLEFVRNSILTILRNKNFDFKNPIFIDKSLENFFYVEVILKIFPNAIFINTVRNLEDNIFAIYKQSLSKISWTHSIKDILEYTDNYLKIMSYFFKNYSNFFLSFDLEKLTKNPEEQTKRLYEFCNLKWSQEVLNFYNKKDILISTASNIQIRNGIKQYEIDKYKPYKKLLKDFLDKYHWLNN